MSTALQPLPYLTSSQLKRSYSLLQPANVEVTSLDIAAHGAFAIVGCGNGIILCYDLASNSPNGYIIGHIQAKGLHTNLLLTTRITEDCRFCFAGVKKGSSELLAIDLGYLPVWNVSQKKKPVDLYDLIVRHSHSDPKLRGLGDATKVLCSNSCTSSTENAATTPLPSEYRLVCGLGIKNIHVWSFTPPVKSEEAAKWVCMYDVATNGNTIETVTFRLGGMQLLSKSAGVNLRVWDLSSYNTDPAAKPTFEDLPMTSDVKAMMDDCSFGGVYNFSVVKGTTAKELLRDSFELPERSTEDEQGQRRKRMMRQIDDIVGTQDGLHILVLCTDGGIAYFQNNLDEVAAAREAKRRVSCLSKSPRNLEATTDSEVREEPSQNEIGINDESNPEDNDLDEEEDEDIICGGVLEELQSLSRDPELDQAWAVRRVGWVGEAVLLRSVKPAGSGLPGSGLTTITVDVLSHVAEEIPSTAVTRAWHSGYYHDNSLFEKRQSELLPSASTPRIPKPAMERAHTTGSVKDVAESSKTDTGSCPLKVSSSVKSQLTSPSTITAFSQTPLINSTSQQLQDVSDEIDSMDVSEFVQSSTTAENKSSSSPRPPSTKPLIPRKPRELKPPKALSPSVEESTEHSTRVQMQPQKRESIAPGVAPRVKRIKESWDVVPLVRNETADRIRHEFKTLSEQWRLQIRNMLPCETISDKSHFGTASIRQWSVISMEQTRWKHTFASEVIRAEQEVVDRHLEKLRASQTQSSAVAEEVTKEEIPVTESSVIDKIIHIYRDSFLTGIYRQREELQAAFYQDSLPRSKVPEVGLLFPEIFLSAEKYDRSVQQLFIENFV